MSHIYDALRRARGAKPPLPGDPNRPDEPSRPGEPERTAEPDRPHEPEAPAEPRPAGQPEERRAASSPADAPEAGERSQNVTPEEAKERPRVAASADVEKRGAGAPSIAMGREKRTEERLRERRAALVPRSTVAGTLVGELEASFLTELEGLRAGIEIQLGRAPRRVVGFTGAVTGEGATTLALHFAFLLAHSMGHRVLLVDGDVGRENMGLSGPLGRRDGLTELLQGTVPPEEAVLATEVPGLHFLPAGSDGSGSPRTIHTPHLQALVRQLGDLYDWVVIDLAPVLEHPESAMIAASCEGVVLVVRAHQTPRSASQRALDLLQARRTRVLGTVLNGRKESLPGFLRNRV